MATLVSDLITQVFLDLNAIQPGETITTSEQTDAFLRLNQLLGTLSAEGAMAFNRVLQLFSLTAGQTVYTLGASGTWVTTGAVRAQKVEAWSAGFGDMMRGGPALDMATFGTQQFAAQKAVDDAAVDAVVAGLAAAATSIKALYQPPILTQLSSAFTSLVTAVPVQSTAPIPSILGADSAYPNLNVQIWPPPSNTPGSVRLQYWSPITAFATVGDSISLPPGYEAMLKANLAMELYTQYARPGTDAQAIAGRAQSTKASIISQNTQMQAGA